MRILELVRRNENLRKIFGKRELVIIQKQLLGVKLTQSEKNRLSRDIRKKLEAIKELANFSSEFDLKHGAEIKTIANEAREAIINSKYLSKITRIVLFGSSADNTRTLKSDIDIAVEFSRITKEEAVKFRLDIMRKVNNMADIQVYNVLPNKLKKEISLKGKVLYEHE
jgi:predicted nucleotidyltransferase